MNIEQIKADAPKDATHYRKDIKAYLCINEQEDHGEKQTFTYIWSDGWIDAKPQPSKELINLSDDIDLDVVYFSLNIENEEELQEWEAISKWLADKKIRVWDTELVRGPAYEDESCRALREYLAKGNPKFTLDSNCLFDDQLNTYPVEGVSENGYRLFDANIYRFLNRNIKCGYYIRNIDELRAVRNKFVKCGYCGNQELASNQFCTKCLGSQYLKESDLKLVRMQKIGANGPKREELTETEFKTIKPLYDEAQLKAIEERNEKKRAEVMKTREAVIAHANIECDGILWFIDNGFDVANIIYYKHTGAFCFGWRTAYNEEQAKEIQSKLTRLECSFKTEIKTA
ncbi:hypothetical protein ABLB47_02880 [Vibrio parahaemolyticus]